MGKQLADAEKKALIHKLNYGDGDVNPLITMGKAMAAKLGLAPAPIRHWSEGGRVRVMRRFGRWVRANPEADPKTVAPGHIWRNYVQVIKEMEADKRAI